jgi:hypothetical protein
MALSRATGARVLHAFFLPKGKTERVERRVAGANQAGFG